MNNITSLLTSALMLGAYRQIWGGQDSLVYNGARTSKEVLEALVENTTAQPPEVPVGPCPALPEFLTGVLERLQILCQIPDEHARSVAFAAFGNPTTYTLGKVLTEQPRTVSSDQLVQAGYPQGAGYIFKNIPAHLLWWTLLHSLGHKNFFIKATRSQTLVVVPGRVSFDRVRNWALTRYGATPDVLIQMTGALLRADPRIFNRMLFYLRSPYPLWAEQPNYYGIIACLAEVIHDEPAGVVLGALCPQIHRLGRRDLPSEAMALPVHWYIAAADNRHPMEWRKQVVRALALPCNTVTSGSRIQIKVALVRDTFPNFDGAGDALRLVRRFAMTQVDKFLVPVPDAHRLDKDTWALDRAVANAPLVTPPKRRLPKVRISPHLRGILEMLNT